MYSISLTGKIKSNFSWRVEILTSPFPPKNVIFDPFSHVLPINFDMSTSESTPRLDEANPLISSENHSFRHFFNYSHFHNLYFTREKHQKRTLKWHFTPKILCFTCSDNGVYRATKYFFETLKKLGKIFFTWLLG